MTKMMSGTPRKGASTAVSTPASGLSFSGASTMASSSISSIANSGLMGGNTSYTAASIDLDRWREMVANYMESQEYVSAVFWAEKVVFLSNGRTEDVFLLAKCLFQMSEYHRALFAIKSRNLHKTNLACRHLAAKCHYVVHEHKEALEILESDLDHLNSSFRAEQSTDTIVNNCLSAEDKRWMSAICVLKGNIYEALDNRNLAANCFREALNYDINCFEAFSAITSHQMLTKQEELDLMESLQFDKKLSSPSESCLVKFLYESQLKKYEKPDEFRIPLELEPLNLKENVDVMTAQAERLYYNCQYRECFRLTQKILERDVYHSKCLPVHLSCLMELKKTTMLFELAHKLVQLYPENAISWFAVGCYYLQIQKTDAARRYLSKSTTLDPVFGPAWLLYGHSFSMESEHDQAMAAYFKASHLLRGCHLPLLYIGVEYGLTDNTKLADKFFQQALSIAPQDPFVLHEMGVTAFQNQDYDAAEAKFRMALDILRQKDMTTLPEKWEPILNNMAHTLRKLKRYNEALDFHRQALVLSPQNASTFSGIGFIYTLMGRWGEAVEYFHKALGLKRDDSFSTTMLNHAMEHLVQDIDIPGDGNEMPYPYDDDGYVNQKVASAPGGIGSAQDVPKKSLIQRSQLLSPRVSSLESSIADVEMDMSS